MWVERGEGRREWGWEEKEEEERKMNNFQTWLYLIPSYHQKGIKC